MVAIALTPLAMGRHCETKISIFGRSSLVPMPTSPYTVLHQTRCVRVEDTADHTLPPQTEQLMVRVNGDFGASRPTLRLDLSGLGFTSSTFTLQRTANPMAGFTYQLTEWISVPDPVAGGSVTATVFYPDGPMSSTYTVSFNAALPTEDDVPPPPSP